MTVVADPDALRSASDRAAHDGWAIRLAADEVARTLAGVRDRLGAAAMPVAGGLAPLIDAARHVADSETRLAASLGTLAEAYRHVDGQAAGQDRSAAAWG